MPQIDTYFSLFPQVNKILLVLLADEFENIAIGDQRQPGFECKWLRVVCGILERNLQIDMTEIKAAIALCKTHRRTARVAEAVEPAPFAKTGRFDHQSVAFPHAHRVAHPG